MNRRDPAAYLDWKQWYWAGFLSSIGIKPVELTGMKVLDAGCGPAGIFVVLSASEVTAIDPLLEKYRQLPHFNPEIYPWVDFRQQRLEDLREIDIYDLVFCINAINHVAGLEDCLRNLFASLKPGGTLVMSTDAHKTNFGRTIFRAVPGDVLHPQQYNTRAYRQLLQNAGFSLVLEVLLNKGRVFDYRVFVARKEHIK